MDRFFKKGNKEFSSNMIMRITKIWKKDQSIVFSRTSAMDIFAKIVSIWKPLNISDKTLLDVWLDYEYTSGLIIKDWKP